jgi:uncharacterized protein YndB with AHSA1/START domain
VKSDLRIVREYPHPRTKVWRALTEPALMALWGMRPEGFLPVVGTRFKLVGKANPAWRGYVECEVTDVGELRTLAYSWIDEHGAKTLSVRYTLEETAKGTRLVVEHRGFEGVRGVLFAHLIMGPGWKKLLREKLPPVLSDLMDDGTLRARSTSRPMY